MGVLCGCRVALDLRRVTESRDSEFLFCWDRKPAILHILDQRWVSFQVRGVLDALTSSRLQGLEIHQVSTTIVGSYMFVVFNIYARRRRGFVVTQFAIITFQSVLYAFQFPLSNTSKPTDVGVRILQSAWEML